MRADDNLWVQKGVKRRTSGFFTGDLCVSSVCEVTASSLKSLPSVHVRNSTDLAHFKFGVTPNRLTDHTSKVAYGWLL